MCVTADSARTGTGGLGALGRGCWSCLSAGISDAGRRSSQRCSPGSSAGTAHLRERTSMRAVLLTACWRVRARHVGHLDPSALCRRSGAAVGRRSGTGLVVVGTRWSSGPVSLRSVVWTVTGDRWTIVSIWVGILTFPPGAEAANGLLRGTALGRQGVLVPRGS